MVKCSVQQFGWAHGARQGSGNINERVGAGDGMGRGGRACARRQRLRRARRRTKTPQDQVLRTLDGEEIRRVLIGNTLVGYDSTGPFWMYYPSADTLWGQASNGDVDIGTWRIQGNFYYRAWRRWLDGSERRWLFTTDGSSRLIWLTPDGTPDGESTVQAGNTIGQIGEARAVAGLVAADVEPAAGPAPSGAVVDAYGNRLAGRMATARRPRPRVYRRRHGSRRCWSPVEWDRPVGQAAPPRRLR